MIRLTTQGAFSALGLLLVFAGLFVLGGWGKLGEPPKPFAEASSFHVSGTVLQALVLLSALLGLFSLARGPVLTWLDRGFEALWALGCLALGCSALVLFFWAAGRYLFGLSAWPPQGWPLSRPETWWMELSFGLFGVALSVALPVLLRRGGHVGIDLVQARLSPRTKVWISRLGHGALALPVGLLLLSKGTTFAARSWQQLEASQNFGIGFVFLVKTLVPLLGFLLVCAATANLANPANPASPANLSDLAAEQDGKE